MFYGSRPSMILTKRGFQKFKIFYKSVQFCLVSVLIQARVKWSLRSSKNKKYHINHVTCLKSYEDFIFLFNFSLYFLVQQINEFTSSGNCIRIDCSDHMLLDEVISITYRSPLRFNVRVSPYFVQVQVQLAFERVHRVFRQIIPRGYHSVEKEVCSRLVTWQLFTRELKLMSSAGRFFLGISILYSSHQFTLSKPCTNL